MSSKTETINVVAGKAFVIAGTGLWFECRKMVGGNAPVLRAQALDVDGSHQLADGTLKVYDGDVFEYDQKFRDLTLFNDTGTDITLEVTVADQGRHRVQSGHVSVDNFPGIAGSGLPAHNDVVLPAGGAPTIIIAANLARRGVLLAGKKSNTAIVRVGDAASVAAGAGAELDAGDPLSADTTGAVYGVNTDAVVDQKVTVLELLN